MILRALYDLARREQLVDDPDFPLAPVAWLVTVSRDGRVAAITGTRTPEPTDGGKKRPKLVAKSLPVPRQPGRTSGDRAFFLVDKSEYVFGAACGEGATRAPEKLAVRFALFRDQLRACAAATNDEGVRAVAAALDTIAAGEHTVALPPDCAGNDLFAFVYEPDVDVLVHQRPAVQAYWRTQRTETPTAGVDARFECIVTGVSVAAPGLFPKVKYVPGGQTSGTPLVSFNANAFTSYGLADSENAPLSRAAAESCATALQRLVHPAFPDARGGSMPRRNLRLSEDTVVCYWSNSAAADPLLDVFAAFFEPDAGEVGEMYRSVWHGRPAPVGDAGQFYALTVSGAQGRMVVRDWFASSVAETTRHLAQHFADLAVVRNTPPPKGGALPEALPLRALLGALAPNGKRDAIPAPLAAQFVSAALRGAPYPLSLLQRAVERARAEVGRSEWADLERRDARAALLKAVLSRRRRSAAHPTIPEPTVALDPTSTSPGYLCGRLMAILERLQEVALGNVNASIVDRYFGAASATPRAVFVRLLRNAKHHERKAQDDPKTAGLAIRLKRDTDEIAAQFNPKENGFPAFLPLEEQALFILGYHQQRHALWTRRGGNDTAPGTAPDVPPPSAPTSDAIAPAAA